MDEKFLNGQEFSRIHHEANPKTTISSEKKKLGSKKRKKGQEIKTKKKNCSKRSGAKKEEDSGEKKKNCENERGKKTKKESVMVKALRKPTSQLDLYRASLQNI